MCSEKCTHSPFHPGPHRFPKYGISGFLVYKKLKLNINADKNKIKANNKNKRTTKNNTCAHIRTYSHTYARRKQIEKHKTQTKRSEAMKNVPSSHMPSSRLRTPTLIVIPRLSEEQFYSDFNFRILHELCTGSMREPAGKDRHIHVPP